MSEFQKNVAIWCEDLYLNSLDYKNPKILVFLILSRYRKISQFLPWSIRVQCFLNVIIAMVQDMDCSQQIYNPFGYPVR